TDTSDMVEKVARAIALAQGDSFDDAFEDKAEWVEGRGHKGGRFRDINEPFRECYLDAARAALLALREPSEEMIAGVKSEWVQGAEAAALWRQMIDAALSPGSEG